MSVTKKIDQEQKFWAAASYLWILSVVVLAARKNNEFIRYHADQGFILFVLSIVLAFIPIIGWVLNFFVIIAMILGVIKSLQGEKWELPLIREPAEKLGAWLVKTLKL